MNFLKPKTTLAKLIIISITFIFNINLALSKNNLHTNSNYVLQKLVLPTQNKNLFNDTCSFYMYTDRNFEGRKSHPCSGGKYGFTRNQKRTSRGVVMTGFHEGVDIRPISRSSNNEPLDKIHTITDGLVVHTNNNPRHSNYGKYIVVQHNWGEGPIFSLYAHLSNIYVKSGQRVKSNQTIAQMGHTGAGINTRRSHLHFEMNMLIHSKFSKWHGKHFKTPNHHGMYNGLNMSGIDIPKAYSYFRKNRNFNMLEFMDNVEPYYKVIVPVKRKLGKVIIPQISKRYPWLNKASDKNIKSWELTFAGSGNPIAVKGRNIDAKSTYVSWVKYSALPHSYKTIRRLSGSGNNAKLTNSGHRFINLVTGNF